VNARVPLADPATAVLLVLVLTGVFALLVLGVVLAGVL
jgi:hypothetical protein